MLMKMINDNTYDNENENHDCDDDDENNNDCTHHSKMMIVKTIAIRHSK